MEYTRCNKCIMPEVEGHIEMDEHFACSCCRENAVIEKETEAEKEEYGIEVLKKIINDLRKDRPEGKYDCLVGVSGGKDSIMCLYIAKEVLGLNPLAVFIDNGFSIPEMYNNIHNAVNKLNIDFISFRTNDLKGVFKELLLTKKPVYYCRICHEMLDIYLREIAQKYDINILLGGYTKGQGYARTSELYWIYDESDRNTIETLIKKPEYERIADIVSNHAMYLYENFDSISQINPFEYMDYDDKSIIEFLEEEYDFKLPQKSWPKTSTNCLFNYVSQYLAQKNFGYSQHEVELSTLIRNGEMTRERGIDIIETPITREILDEVLQKLNLKYDDVV